MDASPPPEDPVNPPFTQRDVLRDVLLFGGVGLSLGVSSGMALVRQAPGVVATSIPGIIWRFLFRLILAIPLAAWPIILILLLYGFGALFFQAGPERGVVRTLALGLMLVLGRLIIAG